MLIDGPVSKSKTACMSVGAVFNPDGSVKEVWMRIKKDVFDKRTIEELTKLIEHEFGHVVGLDDHFDVERCGTIMGQAELGCKPKSKEISKKDVKKVNEYVADPSKCSGKTRKPKNNIGGGGGYIDPDPVPNLYPVICYYYYDVIDYYTDVEIIDDEPEPEVGFGGEYDSSRYVLSYVVCY